MINHDRLAKELLTTFFAEFLDLFLPDLSGYLERSSLEFLDKEVFTDVTAGTRHEADLVAKAKLRGQASFFLVHLEHQHKPRRSSPAECSTILQHYTPNTIYRFIPSLSSPMARYILNQANIV